MKKQHWLAMGTDLGFAISQNASTACQQLVARPDDVVDLVADVMDPAIPVLFKETWRSATMPPMDKAARFWCLAAQ